MQSSSSTCLLASSSTYHTSPKNWQASFGQLALSYGFTGNVPSLPKKTQSNKSKVMTSKASNSIHSTVSSQSTFAESRITKDYEAAFGHLSSAYGFAGSVPSLPSKDSKSTLPNLSKRPLIEARSSKDYQRAYGDLSSTYGNGAPMASKS